MRKKLALVLLEPACSSWRSDFEHSDAPPWAVAPWAHPWSAVWTFTQAWMRLFWSFAPGFSGPLNRDE